MDKKEYILRSLSNIGLNNHILELEKNLEFEKNSQKNYNKKIKQLFGELITKNKKVETEKEKLNLQLIEKQKEIDILNKQIIYYQKVLDKIPKFFLKFILKNKEIKLLEKGVYNYEKKRL